jgi:thiamine-monophosphate kinase
VTVVKEPGHLPGGEPGQPPEDSGSGAGDSGAESPASQRQAPPQTLADLGEWELIRRLGAFAPPGQFADDAALLKEPEASTGPAAEGIRAGIGSPAAASRSLVINTDVLVEGVHFSDATTAAADVGWRAAAANLSDLAAMGCTEAMGITVGLVAPASTPWSWVEGVYKGLSQALQAHGGVLLGGDCSGGAQRLLAITALGRLPVTGGAIQRGDGRPGDRLVCTGPHGLSRLGLALLQGELASDRMTAKTMHPSGSQQTVGRRASGPAPFAPHGEEQSSDPHPALAAALIERAISAHQRPIPRFDAVLALIRSRPEASPWRVGGCDSSDGLAEAVRAIATASGCCAVLDRRCLPLDPAMATLPLANDWCLHGGEDFELVLAMEADWAAALVTALPGASLIGELAEGVGGTLEWSDGTPPTIASLAEAGYQHFR